MQETFFFKKRDGHTDRRDRYAFEEPHSVTPMFTQPVSPLSQSGSFSTALLLLPSRSVADGTPEVEMGIRAVGETKSCFRISRRRSPGSFVHIEGTDWTRLPIPRTLRELVGRHALFSTPLLNGPRHNIHHRPVCSRCVPPGFLLHFSPPLSRLVNQCLRSGDRHACPGGQFHCLWVVPASPYIYD